MEDTRSHIYHGRRRCSFWYCLLFASIAVASHRINFDKFCPQATMTVITDRACSQHSGSDATTPVASYSTNTSTGEGLHVSASMTGIWTSSIGLRHSDKVMNSSGPTPILTDTLKRVRKYAPQA